MKGKKFIVIMAIFIILCSIQATTAFEDNNLTQVDIQLADVNTGGISEISVDDSSSNTSNVQTNVDSDNQVNADNDLKASNIASSSAASVNANSNLLGVGSDDLVGITAGTFIYGVDYDDGRVDDDIIPLERFFKALYWGIRDYMQANPSATREWDVFLNNKTFTGGYGDAGVGTIQTGYLSSTGSRVNYLTFNGMNFNKNMALTIHLYGGATKDDGLTSTLDLTDYGANYALLDFSTPNSSIQGINFKNFNVNDHPNTVDSSTTVPFIKLGDKSNPSLHPELLIKDCTFENITLNPEQPLYEVGHVKDLHFSKQYDTSSLSNLIKFIFWRVRDDAKNGIMEFNIFLDNNTFDGAYNGNNAISTGYYSWDNTGSSGRAKYITFRNLNPNDNSFSYNRNITVNIYGGFSKDDGKTSTIDLSEYAVDYRFMDLSGGSSTLTGINFKNFNASKYSPSETTSMPFIFLGDEKIQNYRSGLVNCTFENITLNKKQPIVRIAYMNAPAGSEPLMSGGVINGCTFINNNANQMIAISGSPSDNNHRDDGPIFYGFNASNNKFINNTGNAEFDSDTQSLGFSFKIWNEATNVTLHNNTFINNTNAVHGAAYCIIGMNVTITNNWIEGNQAVYGAGIESHVGNITIKDSVFINNLASGNHSQNSYRDGSGAAIALLGSNNYIENCTFIDNVAEGHAGVIDIVGGMHNVTNPDGSLTEEYLTANNTVIKDSIFYHNMAYDYAGGVHINGTNTRIDNCTFEDNNASFAGATRLIGENVTIINSTFNINNAIQGGACYIEGENAHIYDSIFTDNIATRAMLNPIRDNSSMITAGGALFIIGNNTIVYDNIFTDNSAIAGTTKLEGLGGALYMDGRNLTFDYNEFTNNIATQGGAAYINGDGISANVMNFTNNRAVQGGAIYIIGNNTRLSNGTYKSNNATKDMNPNVALNVTGGAVFIVGYDTKITESKFNNNYAINGNGGSIAIDGHSADILNNTFNENEAILGGAIYIDSVSTYSNIIDANFTDNSAVLGGAIYIRGSETRIGNANFDGNNATRYLAFAVDNMYDMYNPMGGAIGINGNHSIIYNTTFSSNTAVSDGNLRSYGGAITIQGYNTTLENTDFEFNQAIIGGAIYYRGTLNDINDTEFRNNSAIRGGAVYIDKSDATFGSSRFYNNSATHDLRFAHSFDDLLAIGGAVNIPGNSIFVYDSEFINNTAYGINEKDGLGGAIAVNGSDDHIVNSKFENNHAIQGGAFYLDGDNVYVVDSNFTDNRAVQGGAGLIDGKNSFVENSKFNENYATHNDLRFPVSGVLQNVPTEGGAIHIHGENINIKSSEFNDNQASASSDIETSTGGGAIHVEGKNATIKDSTFNANSALKGGAIFIIVNETDVVDCNFTANSVFNYDLNEGFGGAIYLEDAHGTDILGSTFIDNTASINGGAIDWHEGCTDGQIVGCEFINNTARANAGAVFWFGNKGIIKDSNFTNNRANGAEKCIMGNSGDGGAIMWTGSYGSVENCIFTDNYAKDHGGAVFLRGVEGRADCTNNSFKDSIFENNVAGSNGGAIDWHYGASNGRIENSVFNNNTAHRSAGALYWNGHDGVIYGSNFTNNRVVGDNPSSAGKGGDGGAVIWLGPNGLANECIFINNSAPKNGGAVYLESSSLGDSSNTIFSNSYFANNTAGVDGGAINWNEGSEKGRIRNSAFDNNYAKNNGGAVSWNGHNGLIMNSNFTNNSADVNGGAVSWSGLFGKVQDSRFISNNASNGGAIFLEHCAHGDKIEVVVTDSYFENNTATFDGGAINWNNGRIVDMTGLELISNTANRGGAIFTNGTDGRIIASYFQYNEAILGGGLYSNNNDLRTIGSEFDHNNAVQGGAAYIKGNNGLISESNFYYNNATYTLRIDTGRDKNKTKGGAIYIAGENNIIEASKFYNNTANATNKTAVIVQTTPGLLGAYLDVTGVDDDGLGGAIYVGANNNKLSSNEFDYNVARNGSAVYNNASNTYFSDDLFIKNQAWSYVLEVNGTNAAHCKDGIINKTYYGYDVNIKVYNYVGGDNIINGIYNAGDVSDVTFNSVSFIINDDVSQVDTTLPSDINPVLGAKEGVLYQDPRERYQPIMVQVLSNETGQVVDSRLVHTGLYGDYSYPLSGLDPGNYTIMAYHPEDRNYKYIITANIFEVLPITDLNITKSVSDKLVTVGHNITFTIAVSNAANTNNATNVVINEILPRGLTVLDVDASMGSYNQATNVWSIDQLNNGASATLTLVVKTSEIGLFNNTVNAKCDQHESNYTNNNATVEFEVVPTNLTINKTALKKVIYVNDEVTFVINITNAGRGDVTGLVVTDLVPQGFEFVTSSDSAYDSETGILNITSLNSGESYAFDITLRAIANGTFTNIANVTCAENRTPVSDSDDVVVIPVVNLDVVKTVDYDDTAIGDVVVFTITVTNNGPSDATNVIIKDTFPEGLDLIDGTFDYTIPFLASGDSFVFNITARTTTKGSFTNYVNATCAENDTVKSSNATVNVYVTDIKIEKTANVTEGLVNDLVNFTIVVRNHGNNPATKVNITDVLDNSFEFIDAGGNYNKNGQTIVWNLDKMASEETFTTWILVRVLNNGTFDNVAYANCVEEPTVKNSTATVTAIKPVDLDIVKVADDNDYAIGDEITFTIIITNNGPFNATNVVVTDVLPEGLILVDGYTLNHTIAFLESGKSINITVKAMTTAEGNFTNVASVYCAENLTVISANVTVPVYNPDLRINKTVNVTSTNVGDLVNFTINVKNNGIMDATGVVIVDTIDESAFEVVSASEGFTKDGNKLIWNIGHLLNNESRDVWIVVRTLTNGTFVNIAAVNCTQEPKVKESNATVSVHDPELSVIKVALEDVVYSGNSTSFRIVITNDGDIELNGLFVNEIIPEGLIYDTYIGPNWTNDGNMFYYSGSLGVGESVELIVVVNTTVSGNFTNDIIVGADDVLNHTASAPITVYTPDLVVREISNNPNVIVGEPVSFTVIVTNDGDCILGDVYVDNVFPEGLIYTGFVGENWTKVGNRFVYSGVLRPGESINYTLYFNTTVGGLFMPEVIAGSNLTSNATAKAHSNNTTVVSVSDIVVIKEADKNSVNVGELVEFTITVLNPGNCILGDVFVIDVIPDGLEFVSFMGDGWNKVGNLYLYEGSLAANESVSFTILCTATKVANVTNVAVAGSNMTGNVNASADVTIVNGTGPTPEPTPEPTPDYPQDAKSSAHVPMDSKATGNPIIILLLIIFALVPLRRRKQ